MAAVSSAGARNYYHCLRSLYFELYPDVMWNKREEDQTAEAPYLSSVAQGDVHWTIWHPLSLELRYHTDCAGRWTGVTKVK